MRDDGDCGENGGMKIGRGNRSTRRKPAPAPLCPPQIPHDQTRARTRTAAAYMHTRAYEVWKFCDKIRTLDCMAVVGVEVLTSVVMKSAVFWDETPCSLLEVNRRFGRTCRLHLQGQKIIRAKCQRENKPQAELSVDFQQSTWPCVPEDGILVWLLLQNIFSYKTGILLYEKACINFTKEKRLTDTGIRPVAIYLFFLTTIRTVCRSRYPSGLRHELSSLARKPGSWVRIPHKKWMFGVYAFILCLCCPVFR
jgi:hypothetical protein